MVKSQSKEQTEATPKPSEEIKQVDQVDLKMIYDAVIELTKQVGANTKAMNDVFDQLDLRKRAGKF